MHRGLSGFSLEYCSNASERCFFGEKKVDAVEHEKERRFDNDYRWTPTPEIEGAILKPIFG